MGILCILGCERLGSTILEKVQGLSRDFNVTDKAL